MMNDLMDSQAQQMDLQQTTRRHFFSQCSVGLGSIALGSLLGDDLASAASVNPFQPGKPHFQPRAKNVIYMFMAGGPSQLELFDWKPELARRSGGDIPESFIRGKRFAFMNSSFKDQKKLLGPVKQFQQHGQGGMWFGENIPHIAGIADEMTMFRTCKTNLFNHAPAKLFMNTGTGIFGRPSMGSWVTYGLGSEGSDLPGFVVLTSVGGAQDQPIASRQWHSGFLPSRFQGVHFHSTGDPVLYISNPKGVDAKGQGAVIDAVNSINRLRNKTVADPEIDTRISQYEMAFRMQASVPELIDTSNEPQHVFDLYGARPGDGSFASNCLLARRLAERGTRFIQLYHRGWDHHGGVKNGVLTTAKHVDKASAALIRDLKDRGMLDDTLVIWGGEFGRTPMAQGSGRDHHMKGFSFWLAGGGIKGGISHGNTDDFGYHSVEDVVTVHDFHATMMHLLGVNHEKFTFKFQGLDFRLSGVEEAHVLRNLIA